jgi:hypothetical protein
MDPKQLNRDEITRTRITITYFFREMGKGEGVRCIPWEEVEEEEINQELALEDVDPDQAPEVLGAPSLFLEWMPPIYGRRKGGEFIDGRRRTLRGFLPRFSSSLLLFFLLAAKTAV